MIAMNPQIAVAADERARSNGAARNAGDSLTEIDVFELGESDDGLHAVRRLLVEQKRVLAAQTATLETLDRRRRELDELIAVAMPIANAAGLALIERLDALEKSGAPEWARGATNTFRETARARPPTLLELLRRARTPQARRGLALALEALSALGAAADVLK